MSILNLSSGAFDNVTPSDTEFLKYRGIPALTRMVSVGVAGNIAMTNDQDEVKIVAVAAGDHPYMTRKILATNTTATGIVAWY